MKRMIKHILEEKNPLVTARINKMRVRIKNQTPTFLCPNCIGGILFHDLGLRFQSPTVNLMMTQTDFLKFVLNLDDYLDKELSFYEHPDYACPCAKLGDIDVHFTHYQSEEEAMQKWKARTGRIDKENLFIFIEERDGLTKEDIALLGNVHAKGVVAFTANQYKDICYAVQIPKYEKSGEVGNILKKSYVDGHREYEEYFDFVKWFNEADGGDFSVEAYCR